ncbi:MAG: hypothetical protein AUI48_10190 [Chloroflexi bacterium 13_1_40CM_2_68_14]|nr:MAG: hypothetical protein AUI48_10190 [Chloroflexi bacterium 13_1_40CM_2_68_14]
MRWRVLSYSHQREHVEAIEDARKSETRARRIEGAVRMIASRPARPARTGKCARHCDLAWTRRGTRAVRCRRTQTTEQRLAWHQAHEKNCGCRPMRAKLRAMMQ